REAEAAGAGARPDLGHQEGRPALRTGRRRPMDDKIVAFCALLRQNGLRVSVSETMDALRALGLVGLEDRATVRAALRATAVKRAVDVEAFDRLFDLFFSGMSQAIDEITNATQNAMELDPAAFQKMLEDLEKFLEEQGIELS